MEYLHFGIRSKIGQDCFCDINNIHQTGVIWQSVGCLRLRLDVPNLTCFVHFWQEAQKHGPGIGRQGFLQVPAKLRQVWAVVRVCYGRHPCLAFSSWEKNKKRPYESYNGNLMWCILSTATRGATPSICKNCSFSLLQLVFSLRSITVI